MISRPSPPQEAEQIRGKTLTPESPKPVHYPSPSNIPILEKSMDPMFNESLGIGTSASHPYPQTPTTSGPPASSSYANPNPAHGYQTLGTQGGAYAQQSAYGGAYGTQSQDNSSYNYQPQNQASAPSFSETNPAPHPDSRPAYPPSYDPNAYPAQQQQQAHQPQNEYTSQAAIQALLSSLSPAPGSHAPAQNFQSSQPLQSSGQPAISSLPAAPNLPPRPPPQDKSASSPNDDPRSYHPHNQKPANNQYRATGQPPSLNVPGPSPTDMNPGARSNQSPTTLGHKLRQASILSDDPAVDEDIRWPAEVNKLYEEFLEEERKYVTDGQWDQFPPGSRLFIGNLPTEKVTKRDIFHRFFRHGKLAQISIKQAYGFVQFLDKESASEALREQQGSTVRGKKMHLEISKPQSRNARKGDGNNDRNNGARRRSRSPDYTRGGTGAQSRNVDRYVGGQQAMSPRDRDNRRFRDDYRGMRSPSPLRNGRGGRGRDRSRDRFDTRRWSRSRSPRRYRSPSPRRGLDDDLPLPFRAPQDIPDIQVLVVNEGLPRDYIAWVEDSFKQKGLRIDVLILSPRLSEDAVVRRQIVEGVTAIVKLNAATLAKGKVNLTVFDRRGGANVQYLEYNDLDPQTAAALVTQMKQTQAQPVQPPAPQYGSGYGPPQAAAPAYQTNPQAANPFVNLPGNVVASLGGQMANLDPNIISQLLGAMTQNTAPQNAAPPAAAATAAPDLARLLGSLSAAQQQAPQGLAANTQPGQQQYQNAMTNSALASLLGAQTQPGAAPHGQAPAQAPQGGQPDMSQIMAQLARYQR
ncbi:hypothetical protein M011DRAFT_494331 [Sporormia fimetaria CBS 119925]|uniref:RRM domain-containing protein n=1 Tax=Sporormia fimetaria CBS 119925 TaxID=1340428 RepID=A0A6A6VCY6_9PLEO|nr:hypothetical protein M011DRAFT_494331 [Sporormia fimetaria CBS 119925]